MRHVLYEIVLDCCASLAVLSLLILVLLNVVHFLKG